MSEPNDPLDQLGRLAPDVDETAATAAFGAERVRRRQRRRTLTGVAAAVLVALVAVPAALGLAGLGDDDAPVAAGGDATSVPPSTDTTLPAADLSFEVVALLETTGEEMGTMRAALDAEAYAELWASFRSDAALPTTPPVDFGRSFVLAITIPDDACPPELRGFEAPENAFVPVFVETVTECIEPLIPKTYVVAIDRAVPVNPVVFRLPADDLFRLDEFELVIDLDTGSIDGEVSVTTVPSTGPAELPGEPTDTFPFEGAELVAVGIPDDEFLPVHEQPTDASDVVAELLWNDTGIVATGRNRLVASATSGADEVWAEVRFQGTVGWARQARLLQPLAVAEDITDRLFPDDRPTGTEIGIVGRAVIDAYGIEPNSAVVMFDFPDDTSAPGTVRIDIIGLGDDSVGGVRLTVTVDRASDGELELVSVEQTALCRRGIGDGTACV